MNKFDFKNRNKEYFRKTRMLVFGLVIIACVAIDLISKQLICNNVLGLDEAVRVSIIPDFFTLIYSENTGGAFSMFSDNTLLLTIFSGLFIALFFVYDYFLGSNKTIYIIGMALIIGGAIGNFIDRCIFAYVRDFLHLSLFDFIFNIADVFITFGVIFICISILIGAKKVTDAKN